MKKIISLFVLAALVFTAFSFQGFASYGGDVSPGISVLRSQTVMKKASLAGSSALFSKADYENTVGTKVQYITVTSLPESGTLRLNGVGVANGQTVASSSLDRLELVCGDGLRSSSFSFRVSSPGWETTDIKCTVDFCETNNMPPVLNGTSITCLKNVICSYYADVYEPDGDDVFFVVDEYPVSGYLKNEGDRFLYTPSNGFCGSDKFVIHAVDEYGNKSEKAEYVIKVENSTLVFEDMNSSPSHSDAIKLAESNVVSYIYRDGNYYFEPEKEVSRIDFLVMLMTGCGITPSEDGVCSFTDVDSLSDAKKSYLKEAEKRGIVKKEDSFSPGNGISRLDAAMWISSIVGKAENISSLSDMSSFNSEEAAAVSSVVQKGIFETKNNYFDPSGTLDREEAAHVLSRVITYNKK